MGVWAGRVRLGCAVVSGGIVVVGRDFVSDVSSYSYSSSSSSSGIGGLIVCVLGDGV